MGWYTEIPIVSRLYLTACFVTTTACFLDVLSPLALYYNYDLIFEKGQYWRLFSSYFFFGTFSLDFLFHMYFLIRYCRLLEEGMFRGRTADLVFMLIFGATFMSVVAATIQNFARIKFLGHPFSFMMVYVWGRSPENAHVQMGFLGLFPFRAPYLPWVLLVFSLFIGNPIEADLLGIVVGHVYYFLDFVYPHVAAVRGWRWRRLLVTPRVLHYLFDSDNNHRYGGIRMVPAAAPPVRSELGMSLLTSDACVQHVFTPCMQGFVCGIMCYVMELYRLQQRLLSPRNTPPKTLQPSEARREQLLMKGGGGLPLSGWAEMTTCLKIDDKNTNQQRR